MNRTMNRREMLGTSAAAVAITLLPLPATAQNSINANDIAAQIKTLFGTRVIANKGVRLTLPPIAENGYSVPLSVSVDSPMTDTDHITRIVIFSERNPVAQIADFTLTPASGKAVVETRVRLGGTQTVTAIAQTSDGRLLSGTAKAVVTLAACVVL